MPLNGVIDKRRVLARIPVGSSPGIIVRKYESGCTGVSKSTRRWCNMKLRVEAADPPLGFALLAVRLKAESHIDGESRRDRPAVGRKEMDGGRARNPLQGCGGA